MTAAARERLNVRIALFAMSGAAWLLLIAQPHAMHHTSLSARLTASALMFAAMMLPLLGPPVRHVRDRSLAKRRLRAVLLFLAGYALPWIAVGVVLLIAAAAIAAAASPMVLPASIAAVALWQCSPAKQRCLNRCHAHSPLSAFGAAADRDALRFGATHGFWCIGSCVGLMLLPMLFPSGHLLAMAAVTLWLAGERLEKPLPARWRLRGPEKTLRIIAARLPLPARRTEPAGFRGSAATT